MPKWKRSVFDFTTYENEEKTISYETEHQYRWGHCFIRVNDDEKIEDIIGDPNNELNEFKIEYSNKNLVETHQDDLIYSSSQGAEGITEEERKDFNLVSGYHKYTSTLIVEDVTETYELPSWAK